VEGRKQVHLKNAHVTLTVLSGGGHIAALTLKSNGVNPLWTPPWPSIEPSSFDPSKHPGYGSGPEQRLLAGIAGHNLCFDFFGPPSDAEAAAGLSVHGEASVVDWRVTTSGGAMHAVAELPQARMRVTRDLKLGARAYAVTVTEIAENLMDVDRVVGWTQHATLGPPFLDPGKTVFHMPATHSKVFEGDFAGDKERFVRGAEFQWPMAPLVGGGFGDMRPAAGEAASGAFTAHLMDPAVEQAFFTAFNPSFKTVFGYAWKRADFPWLDIWEENRSRTAPPWNGKTITRGMEFGVSPIPETRQAMVDRGELFGERCYRWIPARSKVTVEYCFFIAPSDDEVTSVEWTNGAIRCNGNREIPI
jgi:hypothetical protein